jgi:hypothetical protein
VGSIRHVEDPWETIDLVEYNSEGTWDIEESTQECTDDSSRTTETSEDNWEVPSVIWEVTSEGNKVSSEEVNAVENFLLTKDWSLESSGSTVAMETPDSEDDKKPTASNETEEKNDSNEDDDTETYEANPYGLNNTTKEEVQAVMDMWHQHNLRFFCYHCNGQMMKKAGKWKCPACEFLRSSMEIEEIWWRLGQCKRGQNIGPASLQCPFCRGCKEQTYENSIQRL